MYAFSNLYKMTSMQPFNNLYGADEKAAKPVRVMFWTIALLFFIGAVLCLTLGIPYECYRSAAKPFPVLPDEFSAEVHAGKYITLNADKAYEVGYTYKSWLWKAGGEEDPANRTVRLLAVRVGDKLLIVQVPLEHSGTTFTGVVREMPQDLKTAMFIEALKSTTEYGDPAPSSLGALSNLVLPVVLETQENSSMGVVIWVIFAVVLFIAGLGARHQAIAPRNTDEMDRNAMWSEKPWDDVTLSTNQISKSVNLGR